jgi:O-succinylbenzoate synthase
MRVWTSPYTLKAASSLNSRSASSERNGVLVKIEFSHGLDGVTDGIVDDINGDLDGGTDGAGGSGGEIGYSCLQPWPELGDELLGDQLRLWREGVQTSMVARTIASARKDAGFRARRIGAFEGLKVPDSHSLITDVAVLNSANLRARHDLGFRALKLKLGRDLALETRVLNSLAPELSAFRLRFDFNSSLQLDSCLQWIDSLSTQVRDAIEFLEDPITWEPNEWAALSLRSGAGLAVDMWGEPTIARAEKLSNLPASWIVVKPAVQDPDRLLSLARHHGAKLCFTSYLDHPLGQAIAAFEAGRANQASAVTVGTCGLLSQTAYEASEYSHYLATGARWVSSNDQGIGFTRLLEDESWMPL